MGTERKLVTSLGIYKHGVPRSKPELTVSSTHIKRFASSFLKDGSATYKPMSGHDPYGSPKFAVRREFVASEIGNAWLETSKLRNLEKSFLETYFPNDSNSEIAVEKIFKKLAETGRYGADCGEGMASKGWKSWPRSGTGGEPFDEKKITESFIQVLNDFIAALDRSDTRVAVDRQSSVISTADGGILKPDVFVWGKGSAAFPDIQGQPTPLSLPPGRKRNKSVDNLVKGTAVETPVDWPWCVIPVEIKTEKGRAGTANKLAFHQLGTYVREVFSAQINRRFVPSLIITECTVEVVIWDRAGVVISERLDYHANPKLFCRILATLVTCSDTDLGFDVTLYYLNGKLYICTKEPFTYVVETLLVHSYTIRSRGSTFWRAFREGEEDGPRYIILDSWTPGGMAAENHILQKLELTRREFGLCAVPPFIYMEEVQVPSTDTRSQSSTDTVRHNRRGDSFATNVDLVHTRTIVQCGTRVCRALENFKSPVELLNALQDVIRGLHEIYTKANVVHRDIVPWNIVLQYGAEEGSRAVLVDFSCAVFTTSIATPRLEKTPGCHIFMSVNALRQRATTHLDDLESIYWLLCFIIIGHTGPTLGKTRMRTLPPELLFWSDANPLKAATAKLGHLALQIWYLPVQPKFESLGRLAQKLHTFFHNRLSLDRLPLDHEVDLYHVHGVGADRDYAEFSELFSDVSKDTAESLQSRSIVSQKRTFETVEEIEVAGVEGVLLDEDTYQKKTKVRKKNNEVDLN